MAWRDDLQSVQLLHFVILQVYHDEVAKESFFDALHNFTSPFMYIDMTSVETICDWSKHSSL